MISRQLFLSLTIIAPDLPNESRNIRLAAVAGVECGQFRINGHCCIQVLAP